MIEWLYRHYILTTMISMYYMVLLGYGTVKVFGQLELVTAAVGTVYLGLLGLPPAAVSLIKWRMGKDNGRTEG